MQAYMGGYVTNINNIQTLSVGAFTKLQYTI